MPLKSKKQELLEFLEDLLVQELWFLEVFEEDYGNFSRKQNCVILFILHVL